MLDFFVIFSKSGIVLFATVNQTLNHVVNGLIKHVFLEERVEQFYTDQLQLKYALDNEFELVYVVGYQKLLKLSYVDKFLDDIQLAFRDKFSDFNLRLILLDSTLKRQKISENKKSYRHLDFCDLVIDEAMNLLDFSVEFEFVYRQCVKTYMSAPKQIASMRTFQDSAKSKKTIASMIVQPGSNSSSVGGTNQNTQSKSKSAEVQAVPDVPSSNGQTTILVKPTMSLKTKGPQEMNTGPKVKKAKSNQNNNKKGKAARQWELTGKDSDDLDFSKQREPSSNANDLFSTDVTTQTNIASIAKIVTGSGGAVAELRADTNLEMTDSSESESESDSDGDPYDVENKKSGSGYFGSLWKSISYNKALTQEDLKPILAQLRDHLTAKNVASEIAEKLCDSVGMKLEGQQVNTWLGLKSFVRSTLEESILRILSPNRSINVLREIQSKRNPPYVIVFCGVNGVGKSTNLAKIANWLMSNKLRVLIVACDTFRAGAIEQLRTHVQALNAIHQVNENKEEGAKIELFERGYGKDSAGIAMEGINYARSRGFNCVMVDTAGRMQDNEPLMRQLAKLIKVNVPDLTLFVGEALVGNEAVDQLTKFNNSLLDCGCRAQDSTRSAINGIVLTKFDTIDDKVGAAISMTYVTGQPILFVGVGQTYRDLRQLDAKAVTKALMR